MKMSETANFMENDPYIFENPILFLSFPWLPLTDVDLKVLDSTGRAIVNASEIELASILYECENILFNDYPIEIFLQRPFILKILQGHLIKDPNNEKERWRVQENVSSALITFTQHLISRLKSFDFNNIESQNVDEHSDSLNNSFREKVDSGGPSYCCSRSSLHPKTRKDFVQDFNQPPIETLHESDDSDEFMILKVNQLSIIEWCCQLLLPCCDLLQTPHPRLATRLVHLVLLTMKTLRGCLSPQILWHIMANCPEGSDQQVFLHKIASSLLQMVGILSKSLVSLYKETKQPLVECDMELSISNLRSIRTVFLSWVNIFSPRSEIDMVFGKHELEAFKHILSDACFYIEYPDHYEKIYFILHRMNEESAIQAKALMEGFFRLRSTKTFLETSSSDVDEFLEGACLSLPLLYIHRSRVLVEKIVRGLAKQIGTDSVSELQASKGRQILLQVLSSPDVESRILGYNSVKKLLTENVGISQAANTSRSGSVKSLLILHPRIIRHLIYFGCLDPNLQIKEASQVCLLSLIKGKHLMNEEVLKKASYCFYDTLLDLQNMVTSDTHLGRAIMNLPSDLSEQLGEEKIVAMKIKFYLKCLLNKDKNIRQAGLRNCFAILMTISEENGRLSLSFNIEQDCNYFVLNSILDILQVSPVSAQDQNNLHKILSLLSNPNLDKGMIESSWMQLTFILRNPNLHSELDIVWPISECAQILKRLMKTESEESYSSIISYILTVLRLRVTFSIPARQMLAEDADLLLLVLKACLYFRKNDSVRIEAALLLSLMLYESVIVQSRNSSDSSHGSISLPYIVSANQYVPFIHSNYAWPSEFSLLAFVETLVAMETEENNALLVSPTDFLKITWISICAENDWNKIAACDFDFTSMFSARFLLNKEEKMSLKCSFLVLFAAKLLNDVKNSTTHNTAKQGVAALSFLLTIIEEESDEYLKKIFRMEEWAAALGRFFLCYPTTALDKQVLFHIIGLLNHMAKLTRRLISINKDCLCCPLITLIANEFSKSDSVLCTLLKETGAMEFNSASFTAESFQSLLLLSKLLALISEIIQLSPFWECKCALTSIQWQGVTVNLSHLFEDIIRKCKILPNYNLCVLVPSLQSFLHLLINQKVGEISLSLVPLLIDLLMCFHTGRGRAHNTYMGRTVSVRSLLLISFIVAKLEANNLALNVINAIRDEVQNLPWLLSALEHWDPVLRVAGLKFSLSMSSTLHGARVLDESLSQIPGGIWTLFIRYYVRPDLSPVVQILSAHILLNFTAHIITSDEEDRPWRSLSLTDTVTKKSAVGEEALLGLIVLFDLFGRVRCLLKGVHPNFNDSTSQLPTLSEQSEEQLKEFVSSEESEWASSDHFEDDLDSSMESLINEFPELLAVSLQLVINLLLINNEHISEMVNSNGIGKVLIRQYGILTNDVKTVAKWNLSFEVGFKLLRLLGAPYCSNTHLSVLAVNVFKTDYPVSASLKRESLNLLSCMVAGGGWGSIRVMELLRLNASSIISFVIECLHEKNSFNASGAAFVDSLGKVVTGGTAQPYVLSLRELLDSPLQLQIGDRNVCPGWECCRHLIQLLPEKMDASIAGVYSNQFSEDEGNVKLFLETLKILFLLSKSARKCAFFRADVLLKLFSFSLSNLNQNILNLNIHITSNIMNRKDLQSDFLFAIHCLQVATNWVIDYSYESVSTNVSVVGECLIPVLHPLWIPALRAPPFIEAVLQFLIMITSHTEVCPILTRTSVFPGALLSESRTKNSLLVAITANVTKLLNTKKITGGKCQNDCGNLPKDLLEDALDLLINCGRVHESAYVIIKEGFIKTILTYLEFLKDLNSSLAQKLAQCLTIMTLHKEARASLVKVPSWVKCLQTCIQSKVLRKNVLLVLINMIANIGVVKNMLSTENFLPIVASLLENSSKNLTLGLESHSEADVHLSLVVVWALAANNQRCKTLLKRLLIKPHIENLYQHHRHPALCLKLLAILTS